MMEKKRKLQTNERDLEIFLFLWRWKLATTKAIADRFFPNLHPVIAYNRLNALKRGGFIQIQTLDSHGDRFVWILTQKSFRMLRNHLPALKEEGFRSENIEHDFYTSAVHLGEWLVQQPIKVELFSEQELRRYSLDHYPRWVPRTKLRRPDGYWHVPYNTQMITVALEVELTAKCVDDYGVLARFYKDNPKVTRVVWITRTLSMAKYIEEKIRKEGTKEAPKHNFVVLSDFLKLVWHAPVLFGYEQGKTLGYVLGAHPAKQELRDMNRPLTFMGSSLLDSRKSPFPSRTSTRPAKTDFIDCMAYRPSKYPTQSNHIQASISVSITPPSINHSHQQENNIVTHKVTNS